MTIHAIKALWGSTSKVILIRARNAQAALDRAVKLKECEGVQELIYLESRGDEWRDRAI